MAILINDNYSLQACKPFDARYLNICSPWTSVNAVNAAIPTYRYTGLTVNIMGTEYWYKNGIANGDLVPKVLGGTGTLTGATNGLNLFSSGTSVGLGGILMTDTIILNPSYSLLLSGATNSSVCLVNQSPYYLPFILPVHEQTLISQTCDNITLSSVRVSCGKSGGISLGVISGATSGVLIYGTGSNCIDGDILLYGASYGISLSGSCTNFSTPIKLYTTPSGGSTCDSILVWNSGDKLLKQIAVSAITSGITGTITGGTNGLYAIGQDIALGGSLTGNTNINTNSHILTLSGITGKISSYIGNSTNYAYSCVSDGYITLETQNGTNGAYIDLNRTGNTITTCAKGGNLLYCTNQRMFITAPSGATYAADYSANFTTNSLVTKKYVDINQNNFCVAYTTTDPYDMSGDLTTGFLGVSGASYILLPSSPTLGRQLIVSDICGNALSDSICIDGNGKNIANNGCAIINTDYGSITLLFNGYCWSPIAFVN